MNGFIYAFVLLCAAVYVKGFPSEPIVKDCGAEKSVSGPCKAFMLKYAYDKETGKCVQFVYGGCEGNGNRFDTEEECNNFCKVNAKSADNLKNCDDEKSITGPCKAHMFKYSYDKEIGKCVQFVYGGCDGNGNRFDTEEECNNMCQIKAQKSADEKTLTPVKCSHKPDSGLCYAYFKRFFFNETSRKCEEFIYGGCGGNENNFETQEECSTECIVKELKVSNPCTEDVEVGPCEAAIRRFYFNYKSGKCQEFTYGGCQGNENNFKTIEECQNTCPEIKTVQLVFDASCDIKPQSGPCEAYFKRYFYNPNTKKCESFIYGGCEPNANNYETLEKCNDRCITHHAQQ